MNRISIIFLMRSYNKNVGPIGLYCALHDAYLRRELNTNDVETINKANVLVSLFVFISAIFHHIESSAVLVMCLKNQVIAIYCPKYSEKHVVQWSLSLSLSLTLYVIISPPFRQSLISTMSYTVLFHFGLFASLSVLLFNHTNYAERITVQYTEFGVSKYFAIICLLFYYLLWFAHFFYKRIEFAVDCICWHA